MTIYSPRHFYTFTFNVGASNAGHFQTMIRADYDTLGVGVTIDNGRAFCYMMVGNPNAYNPYG